MSILGVWWKRLSLALIVATAAGAVASSARAQQLPPTPPQGAWGEVIMANRRWMVVQNYLGQQFPIENQSVARFLVCWPARLDELTGQSVVEASGRDMGSNTLATDHVDVFEGADRNLVQWPSVVRVLPNGRPDTAIDPGFQRFMSPFDIGSQNLLYGWAYPVDPGIEGIPGRLHVAGPVVNVNPLQVNIPGNTFATVVSAGGFSVTRVTRGNTAYAEKGDVVFLEPTNITMRTVVLDKAILYKSIPIAQFRLP